MSVGCEVDRRVTREGLLHWAGRQASGVLPERLLVRLKGVRSPGWQR